MRAMSIVNGGKKGDIYTFHCEFCHKYTTKRLKRLITSRYMPCPHCGKSTEKEVFIRA